MLNSIGNIERAKRRMIVLKVLTTDHEDKKHYEVAIEQMKRRLPEQLIRTKIPMVFECPTCGKNLLYKDNINYCSGCGQRIKI